MTAQSILNKHLGSQQLGPNASVKVEAAMEEYGTQRHHEGTLDNKADVDTFKRLVAAKEAKIRELEQKLEEVRRAVK